jgi:tetratricopeptide (TPR) repeat protein
VRASTLVAAVVLSIGVVGCKAKGPAHPDTAAIEAAGDDALALFDALEAAIDAGRGSERDRDWAQRRVTSLADDGGPAYPLARAGIAGRAAESRGLAALGLVKDAERWARASIERDPAFRGGEARRLLGTMYVLAGQYLEHGDSEQGLAMLEALAAEFPGDARNHLRVAQAYVELGDVEGALASWCRANAGASELRSAETKLLTSLRDALMEALGEIVCDEGSSAKLDAAAAGRAGASGASGASGAGARSEVVAAGATGEGR